jgi:hypothetical protein
LNSTRVSTAQGQRRSDGMVTLRRRLRRPPEDRSGRFGGRRAPLPSDYLLLALSNRRSFEQRVARRKGAKSSPTRATSRSFGRASALRQERQRQPGCSRLFGLQPFARRGRGTQAQSGREEAAPANVPGGHRWGLTGGQTVMSPRDMALSCCSCPWGTLSGPPACARVGARLHSPSHPITALGTNGCFGPSLAALQAPHGENREVRGRA